MILAGIAIVWGQQRFTPYHWTASLPALSLSIGALALEAFRSQRLQETARWAVLAGFVTAVLINSAAFFYEDQWQIMGGYSHRGRRAASFLRAAGGVGPHGCRRVSPRADG
jgi:hypothetical protein